MMTSTRDAKDTRNELKTADISKKLKALGLINNKKDIIDHISEPTKLGVTNQYIFISINGIKKPHFVYRIAGKQWCCGFDRYTESYNLNIVEKTGVKTGVVYFHPMTGTQISTFSEPAKILRTASDSNLQYAVSALRKVHRSKSLMINNYNIATTIFGSYSRIDTSENRDRYYDKLKSLFELKPLFERIIFTVINDIENLVSSHNEPYPSNFTIANESKNDYRMVDWEYSGNNNRYWDLAFFSITSKLTSEQDDFLLNIYFKNNFNYEEIVKFNLFKAIVQFTLMLWIVSGLGKCHHANDCIEKGLKRINNEESPLLTRFFQQMNNAVSPRKFHFPFISNLSIKMEKVDDENDTLKQTVASKV